MASGLHSANFEAEDYGGSRVSKARGLVSRLCANLESHTKGDDEVEPEDKNKRNLRYYKGKSAKEKRKLREKRRSTGVVNMNQESTSTGDEVDDEDADTETSQNTADNTFSNSSLATDTSRNSSGYSFRSNKESNRESDEVFVPESRVRPLSKISSLSSTYTRSRIGDSVSNGAAKPDDWRTRMRPSVNTATSDSAELERLKQELETERASRLSLEKELQRSEDRVSRTEQRLTDSQEQLKRSQETVAALTEELNTLNQDLDDIEEDNIKLAEANRALMQKLGLGSP